MMSFTGAIEPLRVANRLTGLPLYEWRLMSLDGELVTASNGIAIMPHEDLGAVARDDRVFVVAGFSPQTLIDPKAISWLRRASAMGAQVGSIGTGAYWLAEAGLLDDRRCTIHWENIAGFKETFAHIDVTTRLFEIDRDRITCAGGTASIDLMLALIGQEHGDHLKTAVGEQFLHTGARSADAPQRLDLRQRVGVSHPKLLAAIAEMESNIGEPLSRAELAARVGLSPRQMERLFRVHLDCTPSRYYLDARLKRARILLSQTSLSVLEVAIACGFASASHFAKCYRQLFGRPPRQERVAETVARRGGLSVYDQPAMSEEGLA